MKRILKKVLLAFLIVCPTTGLLFSESEDKKAVVLEYDGRLVGAYQPGKGWLKESQAKDLINPKEDCFVYSISEGIGQTIRGELMEPDIDGGLILNVTKYVDDKDFKREPSYWNPYPRKEIRISPKSQTYQKIAAKRIKKKGVKLKKARLTSGYRIDLDGNGTEEVVLTGATRNRIFSAVEPHKAGDYSFVLFRYINKKGKVETQDVELQAFTKEPDPKKGALHNISEFKIAEFIDINGDGKVEVILSQVVWEGWGVTIFEFSGEKLLPVLSKGWGH
ncbi:hypothetical protein BVX98_04895 [bacterium F11]|nr:hypothetical protein BVX98_04895 [bacterium F11]